MYSISFIFIVYLCNTKSFTMTILVVLVCFFLLVFLVACCCYFTDCRKLLVLFPSVVHVDICDQYQMPLIRHIGKFLSMFKNSVCVSMACSVF